MRGNDKSINRSLSPSLRHLADRCFDLLKRDPRHPSLHFKKIGRFRSARIGLHHRALGVESTDGIARFWIGSHADYDKLIG
ncbi:MAG: hypothetical protein FJ311_13920 [Rhodospirillales bacterium]|nr:hypothetical protein [Rhodospirillales bacterium]